jgi:hypothetical protein
MGPFEDPTSALAGASKISNSAQRLQTLRGHRLSGQAVRVRSVVNKHVQ